MHGARRRAGAAHHPACRSAGRRRASRSRGYGSTKAVVAALDAARGRAARHRLPQRNHRRPAPRLSSRPRHGAGLRVNGWSTCSGRTGSWSTTRRTRRPSRSPATSSPRDLPSRAPPPSWRRAPARRSWPRATTRRARRTKARYRSSTSNAGREAIESTATGSRSANERRRSAAGRRGQQRARAFQPQRPAPAASCRTRSSRPSVTSPDPNELAYLGQLRDIYAHFDVADAADVSARHGHAGRFGHPAVSDEIRPAAHSAAARRTRRC